MAVQVSTDIRSAWIASIETILGPSPTLRIRTGAQPATCATADSGTVLAELTLPSDWLSESGGVGSLVGTWEDTSADATGTAAHYRIYTSGGVCKWQGSVTATGGGGDLQLSTVAITSGQPVTITAHTITAGNA